MDQVTTSSGEKISVLVADDSRIMRFAINKMLGDEYELVEVDNGEKAWQQLLHNDSIKILLTDLQMPIVDGYELIERLRKPENPPHLREMPVIVLSSFDPDDSHNQVMEQGILEYVAKPFNSTQIKDCVKSLLDQAISDEGHGDAGSLDKVTGLTGWEHFIGKGGRDLAYVRRESKDISLVLIEVDRVSELIVEYGHAVLDQFLNSLGGYLQEQVRTLDTISRISPYRFGVILPLTNDLGAVAMAQRVMDKVRVLSANGSSRQFRFSMSVGVAAPRVHHCRSFNEIMDIASRRLAMAVDFGGNTMIYEDQPYQSQQNKPAVKNITGASQVQTDISDRSALPSKTQQPEDVIKAVEPVPVLEPEPEQKSKEEQKYVPAITPGTGEALRSKVLEFVRKSRQAAKRDGLAEIKSNEHESEPRADSQSKLESRLKGEHKPVLEPEPPSESEYKAEQEQLPSPSKAENPPLKIAAARAFPKPSLDTALWLLSTKQSSQIDEYLNELLTEILPLLEHADQTLSLQLDTALERLKQQVASSRPH